MPSVDEYKAAVLAAEATSSVRLAQKYEQQGDSNLAREYYLDAAEKFLKASMLSKGDKKGTRKDLSSYYLKRARLLKQVVEKKGKKVKVGGKDLGDVSDFILVEKPSITFEEIGGLDNVKELLKLEVIWPFENPEKYELYGRKPGVGVLLYGPPGCGKTLLAKAIAAESDATFLAPDPADILNPLVGENEKRVRAIFDAAKKYERIIIYLDELDTLVPRGGPAYVKRLKNEFLQQMDGIATRKENRLVLGTTNRPWLLDTALRRAGRLGKIIFVPQPDFEARKKIFQIKLQDLVDKEMLASDVDVGVLAEMTDGFSGADIDQICIDARDIPLLETLRNKPPRKVCMNDFLTVIGDGRKPSVIAWYQEALRAVRRYKEEAVFKELMDSGEEFLSRFNE